VKVKVGEGQMTFSNIYNKLSAIYGAIFILLIMWGVLIVGGLYIAGYLPEIIRGPLWLIVIIIGIYLSVKIVRWTHAPSTDNTEKKKGAVFFNKLAAMPSPILTIIGLLLIWAFIGFVLLVVTEPLTGIANILATIIGVAIGCYLSWVYLRWVVRRWKRWAAQ
jgi:uncharacterized membrane protein